APPDSCTTRPGRDDRPIVVPVLDRGGDGPAGPRARWPALGVRRRRRAAALRPAALDRDLLDAALRADAPVLPEVRLHARRHHPGLLHGRRRDGWIQQADRAGRWRVGIFLTFDLGAPSAATCRGAYDVVPGR